MNTQCATIIAAIKDEFVIEIARTAAELTEAQHLRYEVFCCEREILPNTDGSETEGDEYDHRARHVLIRRRRNRDLVGTVRLVTAHGAGQDAKFPMERVAGVGVLDGLPLQTTGEISRFALSRRRRERASPADAFIRLGLLQGVMRLSFELGLTHWCAAMEVSLLRLLRGVSIHFEPVGPIVEYHGLRQPSIGVIDEILKRGKRERPELWEFVTDRGRLCPATGRQLMAA